MRETYYTKADHKRAEKLTETDNRFGGPGSPVHDYPGALNEAYKERQRATPLHRRMMRESGR